MTLTLNHVPDASTTRIAEFLQQQLQAAGMKVSLTPIQQADIINTALLGTFQAQVWRQFGAVDPDLNYIYWSPTNINSVFSINMARNTDPNMEAALLKGRQSPDQADRAAAYQEVGRLMGSDIPYLWTARTVWSVGAQPKVENFNNPTMPDGGARPSGSSPGPSGPPRSGSTPDRRAARPLRNRRVGRAMIRA